MAGKKIVEEIILKVTLDDKAAKMGLSNLKKKIPPVEKGVKKLQKSIKGMKSEFKKTSKETGLLSEGLNKLASGAVAGIVIFKLREMGAEAIKLSRDFERIGLSMNTVFGGDAGQQFAFVEAEAERLGLSVRSTAGGFAKLAASTKSILTIDQTRELFTATAEAASALGLDAERTGGILRALSQIASKGTVSAEELRQQIGEHLPGAFDLAAKSMGITTSELNKMLEQGELAAKDFLPRFSEELRKTFHEGAMKNANSEIAQSTRNLNKWEKQLKLSGDVLKGVTTPTVGAFLTKWEELTEQLSNGILLFTHSADEVRAMAGSLDIATKSNDKFVESQKKVVTAAERAAHALKGPLDIITKFHLELFNAGEDDKLRVSLGLTESGFAKIAVVVKALGNSGLDADGKMERLRNTLDLMRESGDIKKGDFIKSEDVKRAEAIKKSFLSWIPDKFTEIFPDETMGKVLQATDVNKPTQQDLSSSMTPQEGLELGSSEAAKFLIRPVKDQNKVAEEQLAVQKKIEASNEQIANNKTTLKIVR